MNSLFTSSSTSNLASHLRSGAANSSFALLDEDTQARIVARVEREPQDGQRALLSEISGLDLTGLINFAGGEASGAGPLANAGETSYEVKAGDSLSRIARAQGTTLSALIAANPQIKNPDLIHPKDIVRIPAK